MDKFGYIRAKRGPRGFPGKDALDINNWFPVSVVRMFRESECCTFYFNTETDGILYEGAKVIGLKDQGGRQNALCLQNFQKPIKIGIHYGLPLNGAVYKIPDIPTAVAPHCIVIIALSFKVMSKLSNENHYIFSNNTGSRAVSITKKSLNIWGTHELLDLEYDYDGWNTLLLQYSCMEKTENDKCFFSLNGRRGFFRPRQYNIEDNDIFLGGTSKMTNYGNVVIGSFEAYNKIFEKTPDKYLIPDEIYKLVEEDIKFRVDPV